MDQKLMLLGDEAIAQAAIDAGISGIYAYPGTPSTEITEYVMQSKEAKSGQIRAGWSTNEKTAMESALGMSYAGKRTMVCMKHVGLNVAADPFMNSAITGANGGLIVVSADDPSMHSSQNEQDSRVYGKFALLPVLEPTNQQDAYDMVHYGFDMSEKLGVPVLMRITTRLAHSRAGVNRKPTRQQNEIHLPLDHRQFILLPANARRQYKALLNKQDEFEKFAATSGFNVFTDAENRSMGIITTGIAYNYLLENYPDFHISYPVLKIAQYPIPQSLVEQIYNSCEQLLILEEGYPIVEESVKGILNTGKTIHGRLDGTLPRDGELNPNIVAVALGLDDTYGKEIPSIVASRPPSLCKGCPHIYSYNALNQAIESFEKGHVFSDIGCYTLGALDPFDAINSCVDMGASITMAKGAADAGLHPSVAVIGDSTFTHSGITGLIDCVKDKSQVMIMILDNETTAMTGGQASSAFGRIEDICMGVGVSKEHIFVIDPSPKHHEENLDILKQELNYRGVSVIIPRRECIQTAIKHQKEHRKTEACAIQNCKSKVPGSGTQYPALRSNKTFIPFN